MSKTALITGISGQDGAYLSKFLLEKGYIIVGITRDETKENLKNLKYLDIDNKVIIKKCNLLDTARIVAIFEEFKPDEIYNLASQSSVSLSFEIPAETIQFNILSTLNILNAMRTVIPKAKLYQASSSEIYGNVDNLPINEKSSLHPVSPYAISKAAAHLTTINYRETYGIFACCGILFNHASVLANPNFFIKKIVTSAINIKNGKQNELMVGNLNVKRDFGFAPDYVKAMWQILQQESPQDFIISSGKSTQLKEIVDYVFDKLEIDLNKVVIDKSLFRPNDILDIYGDNQKAKDLLNWKFEKSIFEILDIIIAEEILNFNKLIQKV